LQEPVDALEQIFSGHGAAPENLPVVSLDRVEIENLGKKFETKIGSRFFKIANRD
jgi:hypothetical protein